MSAGESPFDDINEPPIIGHDGTLAIGINPTEHPVESVDRSLKAAAAGMVMNAEYVAENGRKDRALELLCHAAEFNDRRTEPELMPVDPDDHPDYDPSPEVDQFLNDFIDYLQQYSTDDDQFDSHLSKMEKEIQARIKGSDDR